MRSRFPNFVWVLRNELKTTHWEFANNVLNMSDTKFSKCLCGRMEFTPEQREKIVAATGFPEWWLFQTITPPSLQNGHSQESPIERKMVTAL